MKKWYSFLEVLSFPLKMVFIAIICYGIGNILTSPTYEWLFVIKNEYIILCAEALMRISQFFIVYFPIMCLFRLVSRRINGFTTIITGIIGYVKQSFFCLVIGIYLFSDDNDAKLCLCINIRYISYQQ